MTTSPQVGAKGKRELLLLSGVLLLAGGAVGGYFAWRPRDPVVAAVPTAGLDAEVAAAVEQARAGVQARPKSAAAWGHLGMVLFAQDLYADCTGPFAEAERLDPHDARWPYFRALAVIRHRPGEGVTLLERAADMPPRTFSVRLRLAEEYLKLQRLDEADALFRDLLAERPNDPRALLGRGQILAQRGRWREALAPLKAAAENPTARRSARVALAEAHLRLGDAAAAEAERKRAAEVPADAAWPDEILAEAKPLRTGLQPRIDQALALRDAGQAEEAVALIGKVLRDHPDSDEAHLTLARLLIPRGRMQEAERELRRAVGLNPNLVEGHFLLAGMHLVRREYEAAEGGYRRTLALKPAHALAHYNLGECRRKQGDRAGAIAAFRDAVRYRPDLAAAHLELGALLLEDGKVEEAASHLDQAVRLDGKNDRARALLERARAKGKS
jgi:tetratricopeptide (TPR) repeat protein